MAEITDTARVPVNVSAGHVSVHLEGAHPADVPFLFEQPEKRLGPAFVGSFASHVLMGVLLFLLVRYGNRVGHAAPILPDVLNNQIVWLSEPGPGGGGGGGGNRMKEPPRKAELPGTAKITVPVAKPQTLEAPNETKEP